MPCNSLKRYTLMDRLASQSAPATGLRPGDAKRAVTTARMPYASRDQALVDPLGKSEMIGEKGVARASDEGTQRGALLPRRFAWLAVVRDCRERLSVSDYLRRRVNCEAHSAILCQRYTY
jgi:hypothetical protein